MKSFCRERPTPATDFETFTESETAQSISARFLRQAARQPDRLAARCSRFTWSYHELDRLSARLARFLIKVCGDPIGRHVALVLGHDSSTIVAMLGALRAGMVYVPLDVRWPVPRLRYCLFDSQAVVVLTDRKCQAHVAATVAEGLPVVLLEDCGRSASPLLEDAEWRGAALPEVSPNAIAYILYTSGAMGQPKGVMQSHENVLRHIRNYTNQLCISPADRLSSLASYSCDAAVMDVYGALLNGASLHPLRLERERLQRVTQWLRDERITIYHSTPTLYRHVLSYVADSTELECLRLVVLGGEETSRNDVLRFKQCFSPGTILVNGFGPTECTLGLQYFLDHHTELRSGTVPIGYPVDGIDVVLMNADRQTSGGDDGEIALKGESIALGYWGRPELTAEVFLPDSDRPGARTYHTGDLGHRAPDSALEFKGRRDLQVKVRGHRVEILEIEAHMLDHPAIASCAVAVDVGPRPRLVAYWVARPGCALEPDQIRKYLAGRLPGHMIPAAFVRLDAIPVTASGKLDRRALSPPSTAPRGPGNESEPTSTEELVNQIWLDACRFAAIGRDSNFFECGGDSLTAVEITSRVQSVLGVQVGLSTLFKNPSIRTYSAEVEKQRVAHRGSSAFESPIATVTCGSATPLSLAQRRYWQRIQAGVPGAAWNVTILTLIRGHLQVSVLLRSLRELVKRHESLRTCFVTSDGQPMQEARTDHLLLLPVIDLGGLAGPDRDTQARCLAALESARPFDLAHEPSFRVGLLRLADSDHTLVTTQHHLITDGWSRRLLEEELDTLYVGFLGDGLSLPPPPIRYAQFASWQQLVFAAGPHPQLDYWRSTLSGGAFESPRLPRRTVAAPSRDRSAGGAASRALEPELTAAALRLARAHGATLFMVLLGAFKAMCSHTPSRPISL